MDPFENVKRLNIFNELFLALSNNKFIIKELKNPKNHKTMVFRNNGTLDIHDTQEGTDKEYDHGEQFDLLKSAAKLVSNPQPLIEALMHTVKSMKPVNFTENEFEHLKVCPIMTKEELIPHLKIDKRKITIPKESVDLFNPLNSLISWKDAKNKIKQNAMVFDGDSPIGFIFSNEKGFFYMQTLDVMQTPVMQFLDKIFDLEKVENRFPDDIHELRKKFMDELRNNNTKN